MTKRSLLVLFELASVIFVRRHELSHTVEVRERVSSDKRLFVRPVCETHREGSVGKGSVQNQSWSRASVAVRRRFGSSTRILSIRSAKTSVS